MASCPQAQRRCHGCAKRRPASARKIDAGLQPRSVGKARGGTPLAYDSALGARVDRRSVRPALAAISGAGVPDEAKGIAPIRSRAGRSLKAAHSAATRFLSLSQRRRARCLIWATETNGGSRELLDVRSAARLGGGRRTPPTREIGAPGARAFTELLALEPFGMAAKLSERGRRLFARRFPHGATASHRNQFQP